MAKNLFRPSEFKFSPEKVHISPPEIMVKQQHAVQKRVAMREVEEYTGPTVDELRREAEAFRASWEEERTAMIESARAEAEKIVKEAEDHAFDEVKKKSDQALRLKQEAEDEARAIIDKAKQEAREIVEAASKEVDEIRDRATKEARKAGFDQGFAQGQDEVSRIIERVHVVLTKAVERRNEIIEESEGQLIQMVLQIAKKVVKVISENQKNVVINNIVQALRKLKTKADINIRVNLSDLQITTEHTKELIAKFERVNSITVMEDITVDPGGCIIETDFGQIDARISSQLREIEERILDLAPIAVQKKPISLTGQ